MNLLVVTPSYHPAIVYGGPTIVTHALCQELARQGVHVRVVTTDANGSGALEVDTQKPQMLAPRLEVRYFKEQVKHLLSLDFLFGLPAAVRRSDVVHIHSIFSTYTVWALLWSFLLRKRVILSPHGSLGKWSMNQGSRFKRTFLRWLILPFSNIITFHTTASIETEEMRAYLAGVRTVTIINGVDLSEFQIAKTSGPQPLFSQNDLKSVSHILQKSSYRIVSMGRLHRKKGFDILIDAVSILISRGYSITLLIVGKDDSILDELTNQVRRCKLESHVHFTGELLGQDRSETLHSADVFALSSHHENFGLVYLEALACGLPVVASVHTPWQILESNGLGRWVDNTPEAFADAIESQLGTKDKAFQLKSTAFAEQYSWTGIAQQFIHLYETQNQHTFSA